MGSTSFWGFSYPNLLLVFLKILLKKLRFLYKIWSHKNRPKGGGIASSSVILFFYLLYWYYSYINSIFCLCPSFRVWSDGLYFLFGVFLP